MRIFHIKKTFKLKGFILKDIEYQETKILLHCRLQSQTMQYKGERSSIISEKRVRHISHMMLEDRLVEIVIEQRRFYFSKHKTKRWESLPGVQYRKQTTDIFRLNTLRELQRDNYSQTGLKRGKSGMFASKLLDSLPLKLEWQPEITKVGLDGKGVRKHKVVHNITNLDKNEVIGVLPSFNQKKLKKELLKIPLRDRLLVRETCTDMDPFYINTALEVFPNTNIVLDHYHVIALAIRQLDAVRVSFQNVTKKRFQVKQLFAKPAHKLSEKEYSKLKECFIEFPDVKRAWNVINQLRKVYWQDNWKRAHSELRKTIWYCEESFIPEMQSLAKTLRRWKYEILNYYISKTTNAFTEGSHTRFEQIKRTHCGIKNVERFAKRLMFCFTPFIIIANVFAQSV